MAKLSLKNIIAYKKGTCRVCSKPIEIGQEISILAEPDQFYPDKARPDFTVTHRYCMDKYLLTRQDIGYPVSRVSEKEDMLLNPEVICTICGERPCGFTAAEVRIKKTCLRRQDKPDLTEKFCRYARFPLPPESQKSDEQILLKCEECGYEARKKSWQCARCTERAIIEVLEHLGIKEDWDRRPIEQSVGMIVMRLQAEERKK